MEDVLDLYHGPYDKDFPLICMDESNKQLVGEVHTPIAPSVGRGQINDHEYVRNGVAETLQMLDVRLPTTDGRELLLVRHTEPDQDVAMLLEHLKLVLPPQPPPKIAYPAQKQSV